MNTICLHVPAIMLMVIWFVNGFAQASGSPCCVVSLARWWPNRSRGTFYGIWSCSNNLGEAIAYVVTSVIMVRVGLAYGADMAWRSGFWGVVAEAHQIRQTGGAFQKRDVRDVVEVNHRAQLLGFDELEGDDTPMGMMLKYGCEGAKDYNEKYLLSPEHAKAHHEGDIHIHDFDFYALTTTCCQIDLLTLFKGGFSTGHGYLREPNDIRSYAALACIAVEANQNGQRGGQSIQNFDISHLEPPVSPRRLSMPTAV